MLSAEKIKGYLSDRAGSVFIETYGCVGSTNDIIKEHAKKGIHESLVIASKQTAGRGRRGRSFFSPDGTGLYMSLLLRPAKSPEISALLTTAAAVAVALAIEEVSSKKAEIKWINDVYIDGKKACGILCEAVIDATSGSPDHIIVGIGINLCDPVGGFPEEIRDVATSVFGNSLPDEDTVCMLAASITSYLATFADKLEDRAFLDEYKKRLFVLGKEITVHTPRESFLAVAKDLDRDAHLIVTLKDGSKTVLSAGEISIRTVNN